MPSKLSAILAVLVLIVGACSASTPSEPSGTSPQGTPPSTAQPVEPSTRTLQPTTGAAEITIGTDTDAALAFDPATVRIQAGTNVRVTFENRATVPHNLTFDAPISVATSMTVAPGTSETIEFTAPEAGEYSFVCTLHPGMGGTLTVQKG